MSVKQSAKGARAKVKNATKKRLCVAAIVIVAAAVALASTFRASPLPAPAPFAGPLPSASPPAAMGIHHLPTGLIRRNAGVAYRGGSFGDAREFSMGAALVKHPKGDVLIDTGFGREVDAHFQIMPAPFRKLSAFERKTPAADQLKSAGYDRSQLRAILLTHAHWDHVSGIPDFPDTPVLVPAPERRFIEEGGAITAVARSLRSVHYEEYAFEGGPYLGFPKSHDVHGDGSIVVVPAPGHTPGSVIVFVSLPNEKRYAFVGDLVWQREGITERAERAWLLRLLADSDEASVRENILKMASIHARFPGLELMPAHDARAYGALPSL